MSCTSKFSSYIIMISYFFVVIINEFFTNPTSITRSKWFFFFNHDQIFVEEFSHYFFTVFKIFKDRFNKFISSICNSKNNNWLTKFIININNLVSKTAGNVILIFFLNKNTRDLQHSLNYTQNQHRF